MTAEVYRCYAANGRLLYVGASKNAWARMQMHSRRTDWCADVARVDVARYGSRWDAEEAERLAIRTERPAHNIISHPEKVQPAAKFRPTPEQDAACRAVWLDPSRSLADRLQAVADITGASVARFTLYRRYGKPGAPPDTREQ